MDSAISGFYKLSVKERIAKLKELASLTSEECALLEKSGALSFDIATRMVENVVSTFPLPLGIAVNFKINGKDYLIPMALEEPSVVAAASNSAKLARSSGGFKATSTEPVMIGQIQLVGAKEPEKAKKKILEEKKRLLELANKQDATLVKFGGGARDLEVKILDSQVGKLLVVYLYVDVRDAMGANAVNTMAESIAPELEILANAKVRLRILSNLAVKRLARASATWKKEELGGEEVVDAVIEAYAFAAADPFRACTHNKGIMNGIDAVTIATGNDWRAVEAGAHAFASITGKYLPLTKYEKNKQGDLVGSIELPLAVGLVGGATKTHPLAQLSVKLLGVKTARELAEIIASVGLAQNFAALRALATEGIQRGHMRLHARNIAVLAGATGELIDKIAEQMAGEKKVRVDRAKELLEEYSKK
ncbi:MAG: hydroxymethylglutaryl-CoA reductase, degradative [Candidatus Micrarchaeota archaeon]